MLPVDTLFCISINAIIIIFIIMLPSYVIPFFPALPFVVGVQSLASIYQVSIFPENVIFVFVPLSSIDQSLQVSES